MRRSIVSEKNLERDVILCDKFIHDIEHKLEDAYLEENNIEMKRCEDALKTLEIEYFALQHQLNELKKKGKHTPVQTNKHEKEVLKDLSNCGTIIHDIEHKLEDAYLDENGIEIKRCEDALKTLDEEYLKLKNEMKQLKN